MDPMPDRIVPNEFPELAALAWSRDPARPIHPEEAFALYERNWRFVDRERLGAAEAALVVALTARFGHGHFLG